MVDGYVEGYLMEVKGIFEKVKGLIADTQDNKNYQIYIPEINRVLGYFKNKEMDFSDEKFYGFVKNKVQDKLEDKVKKNKFIFKLEINNNALECLASSVRNLGLAENRLEDEYKNVHKFLKK